MSEAAIPIPRIKRSAGAAAVPRGRAAALCAALAAAVVGGCASQPKPTAQLVRAHTLISQAEKDQAQRFAAADLQRARDELDNARTAEADKKYESARSLADRAAADADVASARASSAKAQQSAEQVRHSLDTLRQQLQQSPNSSNTGSGASGPGQDQR